jgi:hypothetical protein
VFLKNWKVPAALPAIVKIMENWEPYEYDKDKQFICTATLMVLHHYILDKYDISEDFFFM